MSDGRPEPTVTRPSGAARRAEKARRRARSQEAKLVFAGKFPPRQTCFGKAQFLAEVRRRLGVKRKTGN